MTLTSSSTRALRDALTFAAGLLGFVHEVLVTKGERPALLVACAGLMGLAPFLRADERRQEEK